MRCGFVALVGPTNSGKSTLLNALVGQKLSIVSPLPQTTYHGVRGILNQSAFQMVFTDTPGYQNYPDRVPRLLNQVAEKNAKEADLLVWVFDASNARFMAQIEKLEKKIKNRPREKTILVLNKVDKVAKPELLPLMQQLFATEMFSEVIPLSARNGVGVDSLVKVLNPLLPEGEAMYPADQLTDRPLSFLVSELIREKIYRTTRQEVPYSARIEIEDWEEESGAKKIPNIRAIITVDSDSRKAIIIGKGGEVLKDIGTKARQDVERLVGSQVCLKLHVKVEPQWKEDANLLNRYLELQ